MPRRPLRPSAIAVAVLVTTLITSNAPAEAQKRPDDFDMSFLWDGGALPLFWAPIIGTSLLASQVDASDPPRLFPASEGGETSRVDRELPGYYVTGGAISLALTIAADDDPSHWFHLKGMLEAAAVTSLLTVGGKITFGRHRPDFDPDARYSGDNWSFPSGHTSQAVTALTYAGLYLRLHGFDRWRPHGELRWWEGVTYVGLAGLGVAVGAERVYHHRHYVSDVVAGSAVGAGAAAALFAWQEWRYRRAVRREVPSNPSIVVTPMLDRPGLQLQLAF